MLKVIYAQTPAAPFVPYPPYLNVSGIVGDPTNDGVRIIVRDDAYVQHTENGAHYVAGHTSTVIITREQALDLADSIREHYGEEDAVISTSRIANGLTLDQAEVGGVNEVPMPTGVVEAAQPDGTNAPAQVQAPLGNINYEDHCGAGDHGFDVVAEQPPHLRDSEFVPAGGRDPGDESVKA
jgi:hypothetical protein